MIDFDELRGLADETRRFIQMSEDKGRALRLVVTEHDVVLGIFPCAVEGIGLHVIKGQQILDRIANSSEIGDYTHTAIAVHNREQAVILQQVLTQQVLARQGLARQVLAA